MSHFDKGFVMRTKDEQIMTEIMMQTIFDPKALLAKEHLCVIPFGFGSHTEGHRILRYVRNETAEFIRYSPDYVIVDRKKPENVYLVDFKCCRTPIALQSRINKLRRLASDPTLSSDVIGQMELGAYENYDKLHGMNVRTAALTYCAYAVADKMLTCEFVENMKILFKGHLTTQTMTGSGTPFVNFDFRSNRSIVDFLCDEHTLDQGLVNEVARASLDQLTKQLPPRKPRVGRRRSYS